MEVRFEITFKINALRGFISRMNLQVIQLEQQFATRRATRKSLHHRHFRLRQLAKVKLGGAQKIEEDTAKKIGEDLGVINEELTAISRVRDAYVDCINS